MTPRRDEMQSPGTTESRQRGVWQRRCLPALGWAALIGLLWGVDLLTRLHALPGGAAPGRLVPEQVTSALAALVMVLFVERWLLLFPPSRERWPAFVVGHTVGTVFFAFGHYALMVLMRWLWFTLSGQGYIWREPFFNNLLLEYQKDIKIYLGIVAVILAYRFVVRPDAPVSASPASASAGPATPANRNMNTAPGDRPSNTLTVQTGTGTLALALEDIDYFATARNYVSAHAGGREYLLRDTLTAVLDRLPPGRFLRIHRQYAVNRDRVLELRGGSGNTRVALPGDRELPVSRSYRNSVSAAVAGDDNA